MPAFVWAPGGYTTANLTVRPRAADAIQVNRIDISALHRHRREAASVSCPRCHSMRTHEQSRYGSTPCKAQYRCDDCLEPFDYFKPH